MNSLGPDAGPDLDLNCLILKEFFEKVNLAVSSSQFSTSQVEESTGEDCCCFKPYQGELTLSWLVATFII